MNYASSSYIQNHPTYKTSVQQMPTVTWDNNVPIGREDYELGIIYSNEKLRSLDIIERLGGSIRLGSLKFFLDHVLPPMKPGLDVDRVYNSCIKRKILSKKRGSKEYTWKGVRKNSRGTKAHKTRFVDIFRTVTGMAWEDTSISTFSGVSSTCFGILDNNPEMGSGNNGNNAQDNVIYLENTLESLSGCSEEERLCNTSFSFHFKSSSSKSDTYDVRFNLCPFTNANTLHL